jgi:hypothetical protein
MSLSRGHAAEGSSLRAVGGLDWRAVLVREAPVLAVLAVYAFVVAATAPAQVVADTWLSLVSGREVVEHGLPHQVALTIYAHGREWVDQQWGAQLALYGLYAAGGLKLVLLVNWLFVVAAFASALAAARLLGASPRSVALVAPLAMISALWALQARAQSFAFLLFVWVLYLLAADSRRPTPRVLIVLPLLVLWGNIHGSVTLGALLCLLAGVVSLASSERRRLKPVRTRAMLLVLSPVLLLVSPYAPGLPGYYRHLLINPTFSHLVNEWRPSSPSHVTAPFYVLAFATTWFVARAVVRFTAFQVLALAVTLAAGIEAIRSISWFALSALVLLPIALDGGRWRIGLPQRIRASLAAAALILVLASGAFAAARTTSSLTTKWPRGAVDAVHAAAARQEARVFADDRLADWLLFELPDLRGRVAYDISFELLTDPQLERLAAFDDRRGDDWRRAARGYRVLAISTEHRPELWSALRADRGNRVVYEHAGVGVLVRSQ